MVSGKFRQARDRRRLRGKVVLKGSPEEQYMKMNSVHGMHRRVLEAFEAMQSGPNPLTQRDIDALVEKRPQRYLALATVKLGLKEAVR